MKNSVLACAVAMCGVFGSSGALIAGTTEALRSADTPPAVSNEVVVAQNNDYFVILGSFQLNQHAAAQQRMRQVQNCGLAGAYIVNTNDYPGLRNRLYAVVLGPFGYNLAQSEQFAARRCVSDAYAKSGW